MTCPTPHIKSCSSKPPKRKPADEGRQDPGQKWQEPKSTAPGGARSRWPAAPALPRVRRNNELLGRHEPLMFLRESLPPSPGRGNPDGKKKHQSSPQAASEGRSCGRLRCGDGPLKRRSEQHASPVPGPKKEMQPPGQCFPSYRGLRMAFIGRASGAPSIWRCDERARQAPALNNETSGSPCTENRRGNGDNGTAPTMPLTTSRQSRRTLDRHRMHCQACCSS